MDAYREKYQASLCPVWARGLTGSDLANRLELLVEIHDELNLEERALLSEAANRMELSGQTAHPGTPEDRYHQPLPTGLRNAAPTLPGL
jgi:hypothetical protein